MSAREIEDLLVLGDTVYTTTPENAMQFAQFMHKLGRLKNEATSWKDFFFPLALGNGS
jgi:NitT/TauT family transport system substrate-binding protein